MTTKEEFKLREQTSYTGTFWHTEKTAQKSANAISKRNSRYYTTIKGKPNNIHMPLECWAVTDRFSNRVSITK